ncbi:MAG TPA: hypothetical protein PLP17_05735 [Oligoflexia bacterium]|nr:hypothetical protein [Oligoflexia bacterium]
MRKNLLHINRMNKEKGSLALEQVLFIGAVVALSAGLFIFYDNLSSYFSSITFAPSPKNFGAAPGNPGTSGN